MDHTPSAPAQTLSSKRNPLGALGLTAWVAVSTFGGCASTTAKPQTELLHAWTQTNWQFPSQDARERFIKQRVFERAPIHGVEADATGALYVSTPRILDKRVPATFNKVIVVDGKPTLQPWPSSEAHDLANPEGLRNILGATVDTKNRIWMLDMGYVGTESTAGDGGQKLVAFAADTGEEVARYPISAELADPSTSFLNDIALDEARSVAYLSDSGNRGGSPTPAGIIVIDLNSGAGRRVLASHPAVRDDPTRPLYVNGEPALPDQKLAVGINGISLSPDGETLYWSITTGDAIYAIDAALLRDPSASASSLAQAIQGPYRFGGGSDGIMTMADGRVLVTDITNNRVLAFDPNAKSFTTVVEGSDFIWPDSLAHDFHGNILLTTNHLNHAFSGVMRFDTTEPNFRIYRFAAKDVPTP